MRRARLWLSLCCLLAWTLPAAAQSSQDRTLAEATTIATTGLVVLTTGFESDVMLISRLYDTAIGVAVGLLLFGFAMFVSVEWNQSLAELSPADRLHNAWFQSVTFRTAGFNSVDFGGLPAGADRVAAAGGEG